jgi:hypothetical protein
MGMHGVLSSTYDSGQGSIDEVRQGAPEGAGDLDEFSGAELTFTLLESADRSSIKLDGSPEPFLSHAGILAGLREA